MDVRKIMVELGKILLLYGVFLIIAVGFGLLGFPCEFDPQLHGVFQSMSCSTVGILSFVFVFGFPVLPLIVYYFFVRKK